MITVRVSEYGTAAAADNISVEIITYCSTEFHLIEFPASLDFSLSLCAACMLFHVEQFIDSVKLFLLLIVVEAIITYGMESIVRNMDDHLFQQFKTAFPDFNALFSLMVIVIPFYFICFPVIFENSAFSHGRPSGIAHHVIDTSADIF